MTIPDRDINKVIELLRILRRKNRIPLESMARDARMGTSTLYKILVYGDMPKPGSWKEDRLFDLVDRLKMKYPSQEITLEDHLKEI